MTGYDELQRKLKALSDGTANEEVLQWLGRKVVIAAQNNLESPKRHSKTGNLARSIRTSEVDAQKQSIEVRAGGISGVNYATWLEFGTGIYGEGPGAIRQPITPKRAKFLRFPAQGAGVRLSGNLTSAQQTKGGGWQFRRSVRGIEPVRYMRNAVSDVAKTAKLADQIAIVWNKA